MPPYRDWWYTMEADHTREFMNNFRQMLREKYNVSAIGWDHVEHYYNTYVMQIPENRDLRQPQV